MSDVPKVKPGFATSQMTMSGLSGLAIVKIATLPVPSMAHAIVLAVACASIAWVAVDYNNGRTQVTKPK